MARMSLPLGRRKAVYGATRDEVASKLRTEQTAAENQMVQTGPATTVAEFFTAWLNGAKTRLRPWTWGRYQEAIVHHIIPALGTKPLRRLTAEHLEELYALKAGEGYAQRTILHLHVLLGTVLKQAERRGKVVRNVQRLVDAPKVEHTEPVVLDVEQVVKLLDAASGDRFAALYHLAAGLGLRQGELLALRWRDVNLDAGTLKVTGTLKRIAPGQRAYGETITDKWCIAPPKSRQSRRDLRLSERQCAILRSHRARQGAERMKLGKLWGGHDLVFPNEVGQPMEPQNLVTRSFTRLLKKAGLPAVTFHSLRHFAATAMLQAGASVVTVSRIVGHSRPSTTTDIYAHALPNDDDAAATVANLSDRLATGVKTGVKRARRRS